VGEDRGRTGGNLERERTIPPEKKEEGGFSPLLGIATSLRWGHRSFAAGFLSTLSGSATSIRNGYEPMLTDNSQIKN